jgi:hypothetical protein
MNIQRFELLVVCKHAHTLVLVSCNRSSFMNSPTAGIPFESREAAKDLSPGREPWVRRASPRPSADGHLFPAGAGEGKGEREGASTHGWRRGLSYGAPSELSYAANLCLRSTVCCPLP